MRSMKLALLTATLTPILALASCSSPPPKVIGEMENPATGAVVRLYQEIWFKVPADYDEAQHLATWKQEQIAKGFTRQRVP